MEYKSHCPETGKMSHQSVHVLCVAWLVWWQKQEAGKKKLMASCFKGTTANQTDEVLVLVCQVSVVIHTFVSSLVRKWKNIKIEIAECPGLQHFAYMHN